MLDSDCRAVEDVEFVGGQLHSILEDTAQGAVGLFHCGPLGAEWWEVVSVVNPTHATDVVDGLLVPLPLHRLPGLENFAVNAGIVCGSKVGIPDLLEGCNDALHGVGSRAGWCQGRDLHTQHLLTAVEAVITSFPKGVTCLVLDQVGGTQISILVEWRSQSS